MKRIDYPSALIYWIIIGCLSLSSLNANGSEASSPKVSGNPVKPDQIEFYYNAKGLVIKIEVKKAQNQGREVIELSPLGRLKQIGWYGNEELFSGYRLVWNAQDELALSYLYQGAPSPIDSQDIWQNNTDLAGRIQALAYDSITIDLSGLDSLCSFYLSSNISSAYREEPSKESAEGVVLGEDLANIPIESDEPSAKSWTERVSSIRINHLETLAQHWLWLQQYTQLDDSLQQIAPKLLANKEMIGGPNAMRIDSLNAQLNQAVPKMDLPTYILQLQSILKEFQSMEIAWQQQQKNQALLDKYLDKIEVRLPQFSQKLYELEYPRLQSNLQANTALLHREEELDAALHSLEIYLAMLDSSINLNKEVEMQWSKLAQVVGNADDEKNPNRDLLPLEFKQNYETCENLSCAFVHLKELLTKVEESLTISEEVTRYVTLFNGDFTRLGEQYLQRYPTIYKKEFKPLMEKVESFQKSSWIREKYELGKQLSDTLPYYREGLQYFSRIDSMIDHEFTLLKSELTKVDRSVYKGEIPAIENSIKSYKVGSTVSLKRIAGEDCESKIRLTQLALENYQSQHETLTTNLQKLVSDYQKDFPPLYKGAIKDLEKKYSDYEGIEQLSRRMEVGLLLMKEVHHFDSLYHELSFQSKLLEEKVLQTELLYQTDFPEVYKSELNQQRKDIKDYQSMDDIPSKVLKGGFIIELADRMLTTHPALKENQDIIRKDFQTMVEAYRKEYPEVYKTKIEPLLSILTEYEKAGFHQKKLALGQELVKNISENNGKLNELRRTSELIEARMNEFEAFFENKSQFKHIYKKGRKFSKEMKKAYEKEIDPDTKLNAGLSLINMMTDLLSLQSGYHEEFNESVRKIKEPSEFVQALSNYVKTKP